MPLVTHSPPGHRRGGFFAVNSTGIDSEKKLNKRSPMNIASFLIVLLLAICGTAFSQSGLSRGLSSGYETRSEIKAVQVVKDYHMKNIPQTDERFQSVLKSVNAAANYASKLKTKSTFKIYSTLETGRYLARSVAGSGYDAPLISIEIAGQVLADGDVVKIAVDESGLYSYKTVAGSRATLHNYKIADDPKPVELTAGELAEKLEGGQTFDVGMGPADPIPCKDCNGAGIDMAHRKAGAKSICKTCRGEGKLLALKIYRIMW